MSSGCKRPRRRRARADGEVAAEVRRDQPIGGVARIFEQLEVTDMEKTSAKGPRRPSSAAKPKQDGAVVYVRYSHAVAQRICDALAAGLSWNSLAGTEGMPSARTLCHWKAKYPEFRQAVDDARRMAAEARFEMAFDVAQASTHQTVHSDKLRVALYMSQAAMLDPERFGPPKRGPAPAAEEPIRRITIRRFERALRDDGSEYVRVIDAVQEVGAGDERA